MKRFVDLTLCILLFIKNILLDVVI
jgi:hypothetical protein